jgi:hypothetical protein
MTRRFRTGTGHPGGGIVGKASLRKCDYLTHFVSGATFQTFY